MFKSLGHLWKCSKAVYVNFSRNIKPKKIKRAMKKMIVCTLMMGFAIALFALPVRAQMKMAMTHFVLKGESAGGVMVLTRISGPIATHPNFVVTNLPGDDSATVLERLARAITTSGYVPGGIEAVKKADGLILPGGDFLLRGGQRLEAPVWIAGGDDRGFNIPPAPVYLSAMCESNKVILRWVNDTAYDALWVFGGVVMPMAIEVLPGNAERYECEITKLAPPNWRWPEGTNILLAVVGVKDGLPSTATAIRLVNFVRQEPVINVPFSHGVVPGFRFWAYTPTGAKVECRQGILHPPPLGGGTEIWRLKYYQVFKGTGGVAGGLVSALAGAETWPCISCERAP